MPEREGPEFNEWFIKDAPKTLDDIKYQDIIVNHIKKQQKSNQFDKNTFFQGGFGSGKTAIAKILAASIACKQKKNNEPCLVCPTCLAIFNETWGRDVIYLNGEKMSAAEVDNILDKSFVTPATKDAAKVFIVDETQGLSPQAIQKFLAETQSPKKGFFFIFTAMSKLQAKGGALQSRCKVWKMRVPKNEEVFQYLIDVIKTKQIAVTKEFATEGLKFIAENSELSFRKANQMLQQCCDSEIFEISKIKETFDIVSYDDAAAVLADLAAGNKTEEVFKVIMGTDYQDKFPLLLKVMGDAAAFKAFGYKYINDEEKWKWANPAKIASHAHFDRLCEVFMSLSKNAYVKRGEYQIELARFLSSIDSRMTGITQLTEEKVVRRRPATK